MSLAPYLSEKTDVVIIGAGVSGKIAAIESRDLGLSPLILEKNTRAESRAYTVEYAGRFLDGGMHMLHDGTHNFVAQWLEQNATPAILAEFGVRTFRDLIVEDRLTNLRLLEGNGRVEYDSAFRREGMAALKEAFRNFQRQHKNNSAVDMPLADVVGMVPLEKRADTRLCSLLASWQWQGTLPEKVSSRELFGPYTEDSQGGGIARASDWVVKGGLGRLFNKVADAMLAERGVPVLTGCDVTQVREEGNRFTVACGNGEIFHAPAVNVTSSFGALKHIQFASGLPQDAQDRIATTPMGNLAKIQVPFETGTLAARKVMEQQRIYAFDQSLGGNFFAAFSVYNDTMDIYGMGLGGFDIQQARMLVAAIANPFIDLRGLDAKIAADPLITNPLANPNFGGAYPICGVGQQRPEGIYVVRNGGLAFAGDGWASDEDEAGTGVGAFLSGRAVAKRNEQYLRTLNM